MKRHLIYCIALVAVMTSCVKEPQIYRRLTTEEAAIVPYRMGESIRMLNQDGDTLCFTVVSDTTVLSYDYFENFYNPDAKMKYEPQPYFYMREVVLQSQPEDSCLLHCRVAPDRVVTISYEEIRINTSYIENPYTYWYTVFGRILSLNDLHTTTFTLGDTTYENVYVDEGSNNSLSWTWYYSEQYGLLAAKHGEHSLMLIP